MLANPFVARWLVAMLLFGVSGCVRLPAEDARGSPAEAAANFSFAAISAAGVPLGSAVAVAPGRLLTNAHILPADTFLLQARRGDGQGVASARVLARSPAMDLAVLGVAPGLFDAPPIAAGLPGPGMALWTLGAPAAGAAMAQGTVLQSATRLAGRGPGLTARVAALQGYSGGPALDAEGRLLGLVTAMLRPGAAPLLAALTGMDLDGMTRNGHNREVFILSIAAALAESERIAPSLPGPEYHALTRGAALPP